jgi:hypothetical protein
VNLPLAIAAVLALPVSLVGVLACGFVIKSALTDKRQQHNAEATPDEPVPAAPDNVAGGDLFDLDTCHRILTATNQHEAGLARLRDAIAEHRKEEGP